MKVSSPKDNEGGFIACVAGGISGRECFFPRGLLPRWRPVKPRVISSRHGLSSAVVGYLLVACQFSKAKLSDKPKKYRRRNGSFVISLLQHQWRMKINFYISIRITVSFILHFSELDRRRAPFHFSSIYFLVSCSAEKRQTMLKHSLFYTCVQLRNYFRSSR